ncbi:MAG: hypothetical protein HZC04_01775 [Candidatus Lloydbacteria bacterium]|nr:hypothetical protein [Candidatus Lloydbacteria bacterium]
MKSFNFKQLLKFVGRKDSYERKEVIPASRDWKVLLVSAIVGTVFVAIGSAYLFFEIDNERIFQNRRPPSSLPVVIDRERMEKAIGYFEEKTRQFEALSREAPKVADPSVPASVH